MNDLIKFIAKWIIPIGFVGIIARRNDNIFTKDSIRLSNGEQIYWRISDAKKPIKGAGILIRKS